MKKIFIAAAVALTAFTACQKNEVTAPAADPVLYATIEETDATKTYMDGNNNIRWSEGDQVVAFMKTSLGLRYKIKDEYIGKTSGYFSQLSYGSSTDLGAGIEWDHNIVYYPYSDAIEAEKSGNHYALNVVLPSEQTYASESFGNGSMAMVAVSENNNITFRNVLGGMKLQLKGTQIVKSITLQGKNNERLSGAATVTAYTDETKPAIAMASGASTSVTLNCGSGVQLSESKTTEFIIALPPIVFSKGFTVTITDLDNKVYILETGRSNTILRSSLLIMPEQRIENKLGISWGMMGCFVDNLWATDVPMTKEGEWIVAKNAQFTELTFRIRGNASWNDKHNMGYAPGTEKGLVNARLAVVTAEYSKGNLGGDCVDIKLNGPAGTYDVYFSYENLEVYVMEPGYKPGEREPIQVEPQEVTYTVAGTLDGVSWYNSSPEGLMAKEGNYYVAKNVPFVTEATLYGGEDQFKFRIVETGTWDGYGVANDTDAAPANTEISVVAGGDNIAVTAEEGSYDVYFDKENGKVWVMTPNYKPGDYIDEYGINHGPGVKIGETVWAPVNCGYHKDDYKYGKLYQWGRKYGQGYNGRLYDVSGSEVGSTYSDATVPTIEEGRVSVITGNHKSKENIFYTGISSYNYDWVDSQDGKLWNSGSESKPVKTEYDPCPDGWRVPTYAELRELCKNYSSWTSEEGQPGYWFSGASSYTENVPQVFFPAAGDRNYGGSAYSRGGRGSYWSSRPDDDYYYRYAYSLYFHSSSVDMDYDGRARGYSVRCVQE